MRLYIARHGETDWNKLKKIQGRVDKEMNENGVRQVREVANGLAGVDFDAVYSSPLKRAIETARIVGRNDSIIIDEKLYEISFGDLEGADYKNVREWDVENLTEIQNRVRAFFGMPHKYEPLGDGESYDSLLDRADKFLREIVEKHERDRNILVVTHSTFIHALISIIQKVPISKIWEIHIPNCSVSILECLNNECKVVELGKIFYEK